MDWLRVRIVLFALFAVAFFLSRIVLLPVTILKMGYVDAYQEDYIAFGRDLLLLGNTMMLVLYGLQVYWMHRIIQVLCRGRTGTTPKRSDNKETAFSDGKPTPNGKSKDL